MIRYFKVAVVIIHCLYLTYRLGTYSYTVRNTLLFNCYNNGLRDPRTEERIAALGLDIGSRNVLSGGRTRIREYILQRLKGIGA